MDRRQFLGLAAITTLPLNWSAKNAKKGVKEEKSEPSPPEDEETTPAGRAARIAIATIGNLNMTTLKAFRIAVAERKGDEEVQKVYELFKNLEKIDPLPKKIQLIIDIIRNALWMYPLINFREFSPCLGAMLINVGSIIAVILQRKKHTDILDRVYPEEDDMHDDKT